MLGGRLGGDHGFMVCWAAGFFVSEWETNGGMLVIHRSDAENRLIHGLIHHLIHEIDINGAPFKPTKNNDKKK